MIIDVHAHLGWDYAFEEDFAAEELLESQDANGIDKTIVQPGVCFLPEAIMAEHDAVAELTKAYPGRFYGMANPFPHLPEADYRRELVRCIKDLGFVGVKIHPFGHAVNPGSMVARMVFDAARDLNIPVMIHTGAGLPWALPSAILPTAKAYPDVKIVMAHAGHTTPGEPLQVAKACENVYLEVSWSAGFLVRDYVRALGAGRVLFGSDHADNAATELAKFRTIGLTDDECEWCLGKTAAAVYGL